MVDINLFEDEEKEEKVPPQDISSKGKEEKPSSSLLSEEDFGFEEELGGPDLEQLGPDMFEEETPSGTPGKKKASPPRKAQKPVSWSFIIVVVLIAGGFIAFLQYGMKRFAYAPPKQSPSRSVKPSLPGPVATRPLVGIKKDSLQGVSPGGVQLASGTYLDATKAVVENLCKNGQFAGLLLKEDQFYVEYVSDVKGISQAIGKQVQGWLSASEFKASPEERQRLLNGVRYFGVISGKFQPGLPNLTSATKESGSVDQFIEKLNALLNQNKVSSRKVQKLPSYTDKGTLKTPVSVWAEGDRQNIMAFLESLKSFPGNYGVSKVLLVPAEKNDFQADRIKMVFDFVVSG